MLTVSVLCWCVLQAGKPLGLPPSAFVTALLYPSGGAISLDKTSLEMLGIRYAQQPAPVNLCSCILCSVLLIQVSHLLISVTLCQYLPLFLS